MYKWSQLWGLSAIKPIPAAPTSAHGYQAM